MSKSLAKMRCSLLAVHAALVAFGVTLIVALSMPLASGSQALTASMPTFDLATKMGISVTTAAVAIDIIDAASWVGTALSVALAVSGVGLIGAGTFAIIKGIIETKGKQVAAGW